MYRFYSGGFGFFFVTVKSKTVALTLVNFYAMNLLLDDSVIVFKIIGGKFTIE